MPRITQTEAIDIARKLRARMEQGDRHQIAIIEHNGQWIAQFGIRRGKKDQGHDYVPGQIFVSKKQALDLAKCPMTRQQWIDLAQEKGHIPMGD